MTLRSGAMNPGGASSGGYALTLRSRVIVFLGCPDACVRSHSFEHQYARMCTPSPGVFLVVALVAKPCRLVHWFDVGAGVRVHIQLTVCVV